MASQAQYNEAKAALDSEDYDTALIPCLTALGTFSDSAELANQARYLRRPQATFATADYDTAITLFSELGDYEDSADKILQARYAQAQAAFDAADYDTAITTVYGDLGELSGQPAAAQLPAVYPRLDGA